MKKCKIDDCDSNVLARGWCQKHYSKWRLYDDPLFSQTKKRTICIAIGCPKLSFASSLCATHYQRLRRTGSMYRNKNTKDGLTFRQQHPKEYSAWIRMRNRVLDKNGEKYHRYGGRGIKICDRWLESFPSFYKDMGDKPDGEYISLDRIDNDGDYEPDNCRWATPKEQQNNRSNNKRKNQNE